MTEVIDDVQPRLNKLESDFHAKLSENQKLALELCSAGEQLACAEKEKRRFEQANGSLVEQAQREENKVNQLHKARLELQQSLAGMEESVQRERKEKAELGQLVHRQQVQCKEQETAIEMLKQVRDVQLC